MPNKPFDKLLDADQIIRRIFPNNMVDGVRMSIEFISGFELFNTRPYHNYETWGDGYRVRVFDEGGKEILKVEKEDLDEALIIVKNKFKQNGIQ